MRADCAAAWKIFSATRKYAIRRNGSYSWEFHRGKKEDATKISAIVKRSIRASKYFFSSDPRSFVYFYYFLLSPLLKGENFISSEYALKIERQIIFSRFFNEREEGSCDESFHLFDSMLQDKWSILSLKFVACMHLVLRRRSWFFQLCSSNAKWSDIFRDLLIGEADYVGSYSYNYYDGFPFQRDPRDDTSSDRL